VAREALKREAGEDDRSLKRRQNAAYNDAMRAFQDDYYESVSIDAGLLRVGPRRLRLPNARYKEEKTIARARGAASVRVDELAREKSQKEADLAETNEVLASAMQDAIEVIKRIGTAGAEHYQLEKARGEKAGRVASMDAEIDHQQTAIKEMQSEISALEDAKRQRMEIEAELALKRTQSDAEAETLKRHKEDLERDRRELLGKITEERNELERQERALSAERRHIDAIEEGIVAFCEGRLRLNRSDDDKLTLYSGTQVPDQEMIGRLAAVKPRLIPILRTLDDAITKRTRQLGQAISAALAGWASGLLEGLGEPSQNGRPTFQVEKTSAGDRLLKAINPFREDVARVISNLPNYSVIASIKSAVARLRPRLLEVDQEEALRLEATIEQLQAARGAGRD
jgi:DNA repair exonuclease SbcCD ATPase subunit